MSVSFDLHELLGIEGGVTPLDLFAIGVVCATVGYLIGFHHLTGLVIWTSPERSGSSDAALSRTVGTNVLAIGAVTFAAAVALLAGAASRLIEPLYYLVVGTLAVAQYLHVRLASG